MQKNIKKVEKQKNKMKLKLFKNCKFLCTIRYTDLYGT